MDEDLFEANMQKLRRLVEGYESRTKNAESWRQGFADAKQACDDPSSPESLEMLRHYQAAVDEAQVELDAFRVDASSFVRSIPKKLWETLWVFDGNGPPQIQAQLRAAFATAARHTAPLLKHQYRGYEAPAAPQEAIMAISTALWLSHNPTSRNHHEPTNAELREIAACVENPAVGEAYAGTLEEIGGQKWNLQWGGVRAAMTALLLLVGVPFGQDKILGLLPPMK